MTEKMLEQSQTVIEENISFEEFLNRYDGQAVEWHAGRVETKVTNNTLHNLILGFVYQLFDIFVSIKSSGKVILAGVPMFVGHDKPAREPDLMVILNESLPRLKSQHLEGAAELVVEIVSPGTGHVDRGAKFEEYEAAGVREYWLIDPMREEVLLYILNEKKRFQRIDADEHGEVNSVVLAGFRIAPSLLWQDPLPQGMEIVKLAQEMVK